MPRVLDPALQTLIDTGHCEEHSAIVLTLGDGTVLYLATAELLVGAQTFLADMRPGDGLKMSLDRVTDSETLQVQNVDKVFGQQITGSVSSLEGATGVLGEVFVDDDGNVYYDEKMPVDVVSGPIDENSVELRCVGEIYGAQVVGETVASVFPYTPPPPTQIITDPNDGGPGPGGGDPGRLPGPRPWNQEAN